jgi:FkbM family methyltransferase
MLPDTRVRIARAAARYCPPAVAHLPATRIYSWRRAQLERQVFERRGLTGGTVRGCMADEYGYHFSLLGHYEWKLWAIARAVCVAGDTIVEVGANIGTETLGFADIVGPTGRVVAFEPLPANLVHLTANVAAYNGRIVVVPAAVSDRQGTMRFSPPETADNSGTAHIRWEGEASDPLDVSVAVTTLDTALDDRRARLVTMDIEGAEVRALRGGERWIRRFRPVLVVEAHEENLGPAGTSRAEMHDLLRSIGYRVRSVETRGLRPPKIDPTARQWNWVAVPENEPALESRITRMILRAGLLPPIRGVNPICLSRDGSG